MTQQAAHIRWPVIEQVSNPYVVNGKVMPNHLRESLDRYARYGIPTGDFLKAVLSNDLMEACGRADVDNAELLPVIVSYIYNALPGTCWGSRDKVKAHIEKWFPLRFRMSQEYGTTEGESA